MTSATITIDTSIENDQSAVEDTLAHEVGHADDARRDPGRYSREVAATNAENGRTPHDQRPQEVRANGFRDAVRRERREAQKRAQEAEKQRKKKEKEERKKKKKEEN